MHGMICRAAEAFLRDRVGPDGWERIATAAGLPFDGFETMETYDPALLEGLLLAASAETGHPVSALLEDIGHWLCTDPKMEPVRRLFRFTGATFVDLLYALDEVHERARMAVPDLDLPALSLAELGQGRFRVACTWPAQGSGAVIMGILRALADDYGALAVVSRGPSTRAGAFWVEMVDVHLHEELFADPRAFALGGAA